jgi:hypothetical protein
MAGATEILRSYRPLSGALPNALNFSKENCTPGPEVLKHVFSHLKTPARAQISNNPLENARHRDCVAERIGFEFELWVPR